MMNDAIRRYFNAEMDFLNAPFNSDEESEACRMAYRKGEAICANAASYIEGLRIIAHIRFLAHRKKWNSLHGIDDIHRHISLQGKYNMD